MTVAFAAVIMAGTLTGCGLFNRNKVTVNPILPQDREEIVERKVQETYTPDEVEHGIVKGDWAIETVMGKKAVGENAPFIKFVPSEKRIYGNNGCNVINASYQCNPQDSTLSFDRIASTMMMCGTEGITDYEVNTALGATKYYSWRVDENDYWLTFYDESHREMMTLMHQNFDFLNGTWRVTRINDRAVTNPDMKMVIDVDEGKLHGNTGCNIMNGRLDVEMDQPNSISFSAIALTRMACPDQQLETEFVVALEEVSAARPVSVNEVVLYDSQHKPVLTMVRTSDKD